MTTLNTMRRIGAALAMEFEILGGFSALEMAPRLEARVAALFGDIVGGEMAMICRDLLRAEGPCPVALLRLADLVSSDASRDPLEAWRERLTKGREFLDKLGLTDAANTRLFDEITHGPVVGRRIAFDLGLTLADTTRTPYAGVSVLLLALWTLDNALFLYTKDTNAPGWFDTLFTGNPVFPLVFGDRPLEAASGPVDVEAIESFPRVIHDAKKRELVTAHLQGKRGDLVAEEMQHYFWSKVPLPEAAPYEVLVDDDERCTKGITEAGFGRRFVVVPPPPEDGSGPLHGETLYHVLGRYFAQPLPPLTPAARHWLDLG